MIFKAWTSPVSLRTLFWILPTWSASAAAPLAAAIAGLNLSVSADSAASRIVFMFSATESSSVERSTPSKGSTKTALACSCALPAVPSEIWKSA